MRIAIDTSPLSSGHTDRGVGGYTKNLISALKTYEPDHTYILFDSQKEHQPDVDIIHYPYFDPFFLTLPFSKPCPTVITVHDLIPLIFPDKFPHGIRGELKWQIQRRSLLGSRRIIADSLSSKQDIQKYTGYDGEHIDVIYLAPSSVFFSKKDKMEIQNVKRKYQLPDRYMVYVGDINWNKNISGLLHAFFEIAKEFDDIQLVLVGRAFLDDNLKEAKDIRKLIQTYHMQNCVKTIGFVQEDYLRALYQSAICSVTPSHYEGFGLPVLEAMACGCPVICSKNSSLIEIAGPAKLADSHDSASFMRAMKHMVLLPSHDRKQLIEDGLKWSANFSWKKTARQTIQSFSIALEGR